MGEHEWAELALGLAEAELAAFPVDDSDIDLDATLDDIQRVFDQVDAELN